MLELWFCWNHDSEQVTPASSEWSQLCTFQDIWEHCCREASVPLHLRLSSRIVPVPGPKKASPRAAVASPQPSWRHTTWASGKSQASSHTVPHPEFKYISTRPSQSCVPPTSLTIPAETRRSVSSPTQLPHSARWRFIGPTFRGWCGCGYSFCYSKVTSKSSVG